MTSQEKFDFAASCIVPFGKYQGESIESVADTDLRYLVYIATNYTITSIGFRDALTTFLNDAAVREEINHGGSRHESAPNYFQW